MNLPFQLRVPACGLLTLALSLPVMAQMPQRQPTPNDTLQSPRVLNDKRIALSIYAPKASEVTVSGDFLSPAKPLSLAKNEQGVWSVLVGPLKPDYYTYTLTVDGVRTIDPKNPVIKQGISSLENVMTVPGDATAFEDNQSVPHGEVREVWYPSKSLGMMRRMHVYTPPGYEKGATKYPVFYLLHGGGDDDSGWNSIGRAGFILDNLLASGKAKPMIVVMPNGSMPMNNKTGGDLAQSMSAMRALFADELLKEVMPQVEKTYRTLNNRENRAIAGLSMGGFQTLDVTLSHPELFDYVGVFSSGFFGATIDEAETKYAKALQDPAFNKGKKLFWVEIGKDDFVMDANKKTLALLDKHNIKYQYKETDGGHTWINWRQYLHEYAPLLFR
ncbi:alpha/beta hydrolase-fold protein [Spirosoma sp. RP8]|uniref:Alpha/beta hydrolase-fold protein n=1 Tax=Spirosoma liriopis TaxID=2937440 RepID=A0ABT0HG84_9BACT|nr:esterase [Spirosoma liriopis]MCK8491158.1 alpha/beta hydrolase-fold protein [Spirosoma liriopis]